MRIAFERERHSPVRPTTKAIRSQAAPTHNANIRSSLQESASDPSWGDAGIVLSWDVRRGRGK